MRRIIHRQARVARVCPADGAGGSRAIGTRGDTQAAGHVKPQRKRRVQSGLASVTKKLAGDGFAGRDNNTQGSFDAQAYLVTRLKKLGRGPAPGGGDTAYQQPFVLSGQTGTNLLAVIDGRELPSEYVIVGAHYDHLDTRSDLNGRCAANGTPGGGICHGATDNAAGVAAVLAIGRAITKLPTPPRRSVILALWDSEEDGLVGSRHYTQQPLVPLSQTKAYVNFDILGQNLLPSLRTTSFTIGSETGGPELQAMVSAAIGAEQLDTALLSYLFGQLRSDYVNFVNGGVPTVFFSDADGACYHTTGDTPKIVNQTKLRAQSRIAFRLVAALAEDPTTPGFVTPDAGLAIYADALSLLQVGNRLQADLPMFASSQQATLQSFATAIAQIVNDGPELSDGADVSTLLASALQAIAAVKTLPCGRM